MAGQDAETGRENTVLESKKDRKCEFAVSYITRVLCGISKPILGLSVRLFFAYIWRKKSEKLALSFLFCSSVRNRFFRRRNIFCGRFLSFGCCGFY